MPSINDANITPGTGSITYGTAVPTSTNVSSTSTSTTPAVQYLSTVSGSNLGAGEGIYVGFTGNVNSTTLNFKTLVEGQNINLVADDTTITFSSYASFLGLLDTPSSIVNNGLVVGTSNAISFVSAPTQASQVLSWNGTHIVWALEGSGTVQSVTLIGNNGINVSGSPITTNGTYSIGLTTTGASAGTYFAPTVVVDIYGRVTNIQSEMETPLIGIQTLTGTFSDTFPVYAGLGSQIAKFVSVGASAPLNAAMSSDNSAVLFNLQTSGVTAGTFTNLVVNSYGLVTSARAITSGDIITSLGYSPLNATTSVTTTPNTLVLRDGSGNAAAANFLGNLVGNATTASSLQNTLTLAISGDVTGSTTFNGSSNILVVVQLAGNGVTPGTYNTVSVDATGRVYAATNVTSTSTIALTGDITGSGTGTVATTLASVMSAGSYTSVSVNNKGLVIGGGSIHSSDVTNALGFTPVNPNQLGIANGIATLDVTGKLTYSQIPSSFSGSLVYQGTWNATTNTPNLTSSTGIKGYYYKVSVSGSTTLDGISQWNVGDDAVFDGTTWDKIDGIANEIISVNGLTGVVNLTVSNISGAAPINSPTFVGLVNAPTPTLNDSSSLIATTSFVQEQIVASATLNATGDVTGSGLGSVTLTLSSTGVTPGTYNSVVIDTKGRVQSGTMVTSTTSVTLTGDVSGSGVGSVATTLAATGVSAGTYTSVVVNTKGLVTQGGLIGSAAIIGALGYTPISSGIEGIANGLATLDSTGKVPLSQLPATIAGAVIYQGTWNPATNTPTLTSSTGTKGYYYKVSTTGSTNLDGNFQWNPGDIAIFNGTTWDKIDGLSSEVISVAGMTGAVTLTVSNISGAAPLASPVFTGNPTGPSPVLSDSSTSLATTYFVKQQNYITTNKNITLSGDATGSGTTAITVALAATGVTPGTYSSVIVDTKGRVIGGSTAGTSGGSLQNSFSFQVNFDSSGNVSTVGSMPSGWTYTIVNANELTIVHNLGLFPQSVVCFGNNSGVYTMKTPNGNPTGQFSIGVTSSSGSPNTFTMYGVNSTAVNAAVSSFMIVQVLI